MKYENWSFGYFLLKIYVRFAHRLVHKKIIVTGRENLPRNKPLIIAPNHQNALNDPLAVLCNLPIQPVWLARADIFKNRFTRPILKFLKIMPVYRMRDGKENLGKNDQTFTDSIKVLKKNHSLALFPEGAHNFKRQMIPHKKAVPRIVYMAGEQTGFGLDVQVLPVGIYYNHYWNFDRNLIINIGEPIAVNDFKELYQKSEYEATIELKDRLHQAILPLVINIGSERFYECFESIRSLYGKHLLWQKGLRFSTINLFKAEQELVGKLDQLEQENPEATEKLCVDVDRYMADVKKNKLRDWLIDPKQVSVGKLLLNFLVLIAGFPVFLFGVAMNIVPFVFLDRFVRKKIRDRVFWGSFFFAAGILLFPLVYIIEVIAFSMIFHGFLYSLLFLIGLPLAGKIAFRWYILLRKTIGRCRLIRMKRGRREVFDSLFTQKKKIIETLGKLI
jgi:1-acyl-sn-glycerol-3-phosphate acyltransferase